MKIVLKIVIPEGHPALMSIPKKTQFLLYSCFIPYIRFIHDSLNFQLCAGIEKSEVTSLQQLIQILEISQPDAMRQYTEVIRTHLALSF